MIRWTPETTERIIKSNAEIVSRYSGLPPDHPEYIQEGGVPSGHRVRVPDRPYEAIVEELHGPLPDAPMETIVNDRIRQIVEELEPNAHQFFPTTLFLPDGSRDDSWWNIRYCHRVDAIAIEHCEDVHEYHPKPEQYPNWYYYRSNEDRRMKLVVWKDRVSGMAGWFDWRFRRTLFSEALGRRFISEGIRGYRLRPEEDLNRSNHVEGIHPAGAALSG